MSSNKNSIEDSIEVSSETLSVHSCNDENKQERENVPQSNYWRICSVLEWIEGAIDEMKRSLPSTEPDAGPGVMTPESVARICLVSAMRVINEYVDTLKRLMAVVRDRPIDESVWARDVPRVYLYQKCTELLRSMDPWRLPELMLIPRRNTMLEMVEIATTWAVLTNLAWKGRTNAYRDDGWTLGGMVVWAILRNPLAVLYIPLLCWGGVNFLLFQGTTKSTVYHLAAYEGDETVMLALMEYVGCYICADIRDGDGRTVDDARRAGQEARLAALRANAAGQPAN